GAGDRAVALLRGLAAVPRVRAGQHDAGQRLRGARRPRLPPRDGRPPGGAGCRGRLYIMQSGGGVATAEAMARFPIRMIESGPAAGVLVAARYGQLTGDGELIAFDMGGTTAKLALVSG